MCYAKKGAKITLAKPAKIQNEYEKLPDSQR